MLTKRKASLLINRLKLDAWFDHYEVIVIRHKTEHVLARMPSRWSAERKIARVRPALEVSRQAFHCRRAPGWHPRNAAKLCVAPLIVAFWLPWLWLSGIIAAVCVALICGLLTSGQRWIDGGEDDR